MNLRFLFVLLLAVAFGGAGCSSAESPKAQATPTPDDPKTRAAEAEIKFQSSRFARDEEARTEARNALAEYVKSVLPGWEIRGIASQPYASNVFSMDADLEREGKRSVITFEVRKFFRDSGDGYWTAVPMNIFRLNRIQALTNADLQRQLRQAESDIENLTPSGQ